MQKNKEVKAVIKSANRLAYFIAANTVVGGLWSSETRVLLGGAVCFAVLQVYILILSQLKSS